MQDLTRILKNKDNHDNRQFTFDLLAYFRIQFKLMPDRLLRE